MEKNPGLKYEDENISGLKHEDENIPVLRYPRTTPEVKSTFAIVDTTQMWWSISHSGMKKNPGLKKGMKKFQGWDIQTTNPEAKSTFAIVDTTQMWWSTSRFHDQYKNENCCYHLGERKKWFTVCSMAIRAVDISNGGHKIRKIFAYSKEFIEVWELD